MKDFKFRFLDKADAKDITDGRTYQMHDGTFVDDVGDTRGKISPYPTIEDLEHYWDCKCEIVEESKMFKKEDIKVGYVLELDNNPESLVMVLTNKWEKLCVSGERDYWDLDEFNYELTYNSRKITKIYGFATNRVAYQVSTEQRELLWERKPTIPIKEMTVTEISAALGYDVKIVKEVG